MKQLLRGWWFWMAIGVAASCLGVLAFCSYLRVWSLNELRVYRAMAQECHPVWQELHFERIQAGDSVDDVIARTHPIRVKRDGEWVILNYQESSGGLCSTGVTVVAFEGQLVGAYAWSCTWVRQFFDTMSEDQRTTFLRGYCDQPARIGGAIIIR
jgi:hypothetical protein